MAPLDGKKILLVEDEYLIALMAEDMLTTLGAKVVGSVATVEAALTLMKDTEIDCAVLDVNLKNGTSDAIAAKLAQDGIPYIFATGHGHADNEAIVLPKPYTEANLGRAINEALTRSRPK
ncbi:response regulator [Aquisalinus flavus]|uniref:Response regulatory domain-containing protein n=1 Tax=Aquisalinus flavus TaxID=1526572 RepID=A0A8J2V6E5_9PROT|nr:response regulator [Aquisalinus flavus]MBD0427773.1 response regulator [Aquisalinus flavus]UNE47547.1 response regulator [Aquisalinus flavus]GGD03730.1 hypothetical protein GCM10011342_10880 [Aquisalinus flavus]